MEIAKIAELLQKVRTQNPLVHNITNVVVTNFTANGLLALGASPVMAYAKEEVSEMAKMAGALVLNIGTLNSTVVESMLIAGKAANENQVPVILDPVGAGATTFRTETARRLIAELSISVLRGNAAEVANVAGQQWDIRGVDAGDVGGNILDLAVYAARKLKTVVVITGKDDVVSDGSTTYVIHNGHPILTKVTGTGCLLSSVIGAFAAVENHLVAAAVAAVTVYGVAAEIAAEKTVHLGPGSFQIEFLNQLAASLSEEVLQYAKIEKLVGVSND